ncbi:hypothetical protein HOI26_02535 [Candidatus Woesearchaeota archaeon]|jgi:hypothetical protein|nr:hypothetical protein [Candidatus Woesearchaeota archaeon]MBT5739954.1 hypothetical protein [Candidatus Woesearchaeota archaeon]
MEKELKQEILQDLDKVTSILEKKNKDIIALAALSDRTIEDVAVRKELDLITVTVLIYSMSKVVNKLPEKVLQDIIRSLTRARAALQKGDLTKYNRSIKLLYKLVRQGNVAVKEHLQDVMAAARIKKGTRLLEKGLSMGQAAGLMGLSNWDLQHYAGKTTALDSHDESLPATDRLKTAFKLFGVQQ